MVDDLIPMSLIMMKESKSLNDQVIREMLAEKRVKAIKAIIRSIYCNARRTAETTDDLSYKYPLPSNPQHTGIVQPSQSAEFHKTNMDDILDGLRDLFPGCSVLNTTLSRGQDGKMYDISNINEKIRPFINTQQSQQYIVIDWS